MKPPYCNDQGDDIVRQVETCISHRGDSAEDAALLNGFILRGVEQGMYGKCAFGHYIAGYDRVLKYGFSGLIRLGEDALKDAETQSARDQINAMLICDRAAAAYIGRWTDEVRKVMKTADAGYLPTLKRIEASCQRIQCGRPDTFFDAVQLLFLTHDMIVSECASGSLSLGRVDMLLFPFYDNDLARGRIDFDAASEIIDALWIKLGFLTNGFQNIMLGGSCRGRRNCCNAITVMGLRASRKTMFDQPLLSFRINSHTPDEIWDEIFSLIKTGIGFPALFNESGITDAKMSVGVSAEDAEDFGIVGCVEPAVGGREYSRTEEVRINFAKILELILNSETDASLPMKKKIPLNEIDSFDMFWDWYLQEVRFWIRKTVHCQNMLDSCYALDWPQPFLSSTMYDCFRSGRDATDGGCKYSFSTLNTCGLADVVDSMAAIRKLVFEEKHLTIREFAQICRDDFSGHESLQIRLQRMPERYGNDYPKTDAIMRDLVSAIHDALASCTNPFGQNWQLGLYTVNSHSILGTLTGALPSGRRAGASLANGFSPCQGADHNSPTAVINSTLRSDLSVCADGMVLDMKFLPDFLRSESHLQGIRTLIETAFDAGLLEIQFNVVDRATLREAQIHPEAYRNLIVRVSGYSAYFVNLDRTLQNEIIERTEYA